MILTGFVRVVIILTTFMYLNDASSVLSKKIELRINQHKKDISNFVHSLRTDPKKVFNDVKDECIDIFDSLVFAQSKEEVKDILSTISAK
jgi:hypothetical protein